MAEVVFEIQDDHAPLSGIAVLMAADMEGKHYIFTAQLPGTTALEQIALLTTALDQARYTFIDKGAGPEAVFGEERE